MPGSSPGMTPYLMPKDLGLICQHRTISISLKEVGFTWRPWPCRAQGFVVVGDRGRRPGSPPSGQDPTAVARSKGFDLGAVEINADPHPISLTLSAPRASFGRIADLRIANELLTLVKYTVVRVKPGYDTMACSGACAKAHGTFRAPCSERVDP